MKPNVLKELCLSKTLKTYHYKVILFLLTTNEASQTEIATALGVPKQNINRAFKDLISMDIVVHSRKVGSTIFWKINNNPNIQIPGQVSINDIWIIGSVSLLRDNYNKK